MRKRNHTVTIRMNNEEYNLLQNKVKESGRTQQEVVIKAIADLKIASTEEVEELKRLNQMFADILSQLRGATTNINQIARKMHTDGEVPNDSPLNFGVRHLHFFLHFVILEEQLLFFHFQLVRPFLKFLNKLVHLLISHLQLVPLCRHFLQRFCLLLRKLLPLVGSIQRIHRLIHLFVLLRLVSFRNFH